MRNVPFLSVLFFFSMLSVNLDAQEAGKNIRGGNEFGLESSQWGNIQNRWSRSQPVVVAYTVQGKVIAGQPAHFTTDTLLIYPKTGLPVGNSWQDHLVRIPLNEIDSLALQKGGNRIFREKKSKTYNIAPVHPDCDASCLKIHRSSVYADTLVPAHDLDEAFKYSSLLRRLYPKKRVRISFGVGFGKNGVEDDVVKPLISPSLFSQIDYYDGGYAFRPDLVDISIRFFDRILVGCQYTNRWLYSLNMYADNYDNNIQGYIEYHMSYDYVISLSELRFYGEYALFNVDRYFTRRFELLAGSGLLLAKPESKLNYGFLYYLDEQQTQPMYWDDSYDYKETLLGFQLRGAFHYYIFPGLSIFTGMEANIYRRWAVPGQDLPTSFLEEEFRFPDQSLNFSSFRIRFGIGIYL